MNMDLDKVKKVVKAALEEDLGQGDVTSIMLIPEGKTAKAEMVAKQSGVIAGTEVAKAAFELIDPSIKYSVRIPDGANVRKGAVIAEIEGLAASILSAERVALNFVQRLSGIATFTHQFVDRIHSFTVKILDTRKTTPGIRELEKYAVKVGGGTNHRMGLYDAILIKDNHIRIAGGIKEAVSMARKKAPPTMLIEVEVASLNQVKDALEAGANTIMLDNMNNFTMHRAVKMVREHNNKIQVPEAHIKTEASGGVNLKNVRGIAKTGVDYISVGALTHSAMPLDISLEII